MEAKSYRFTPRVVEPAVTPGVVLEVEVDGSPTAVRLELAATGSEVDLRDDGVAPDAAAGDGIYTIGLTTAQVTFGYDATDVHRNFVGYLRLYDGASMEAQYNLIVDVLTPEVPGVDLRVLAPDLQWSDHLVNIHDAGFFAAPSIPAVTSRFYAAFGDDYDFINLIYGTPRFENRHHFAVKNDVSGVGIAPLDNTAAYGSAGRLLGITVFPLPTFFDAAERAHNHELGHQWINFLAASPLDAAIPHWPLSDLARGVMGWGHGPGGEGLQFPFQLVPSGGDYTLVADPDPAEYTDLSLYLMGLVPPAEVGGHFVFDDQAQEPVTGGTLSGPVTAVTVGDVVAALGPRSPAYPDTRRVFRVATLIVSESGLLLAEAMRLYDHFAVRGAGEAVVPFSQGLAKGETKPFYLATGGRGRLDMGINRRILVDASRDGGVWWFPQTDPFDPAAPHQGRQLAEHLRSLGHRVTELPRMAGPGPFVDEEMLAGHDLVIRAVGLGGYEESEIEVYRAFVERGGALLLLADHGAPDDLALAFGLRFEGINRGIRRLSRFTPHPITQGVGSLPYQAGGGLTHFPATASILGRLSWLSYLDRNENGLRDPGDPCSPRVLGALTQGFGRVVFCGDANLWLAVPQPLVRNTLAWLGGA
jgi:hypothetical protein